MYNLNTSPEQFRSTLLQALLNDVPLTDARGVRFGASSADLRRCLAETVNRLSDPYGAGLTVGEGGDGTATAAPLAVHQRRSVPPASALDDDKA
jgi:hypothetical protein